MLKMIKRNTLRLSHKKKKLAYNLYLILPFNTKKTMQNVFLKKIGFNYFYYRFIILKISIKYISKYTYNGNTTHQQSFLFLYKKTKYIEMNYIKPD